MYRNKIVSPSQKVENLQLYKIANPEIMAFLEDQGPKQAEKGFAFLSDMLLAIGTWGGLTEKQEAAVRKSMERQAAYEQRQVERSPIQAKPFVPRPVAEETTATDHAPSDPHLLTNPDRAWNFMMAGRAKLTICSKRTGARFTYKVASKDNIRFVHLLTGSDNEGSYSYLGFIKNEEFIHGGTKSRIAKDAPGAKAFAWAFANIKGSRMPEELEVWHQGQCGRCGRTLTVPSSIASGLGPECAGRMGL
jgi:hypothetical protein